MNLSDMIRTPEEIVSNVRHAHHRAVTMRSSPTASERLRASSDAQFQGALALLHAAVASGVFRGREALIAELQEEVGQ